MAWTCTAATNAEMVSALQRVGLITTPEVAEVMLRVDREWFVPNPAEAYLDLPIPIGYGGTISAPHMHAIMLELVCPSILRAQKHDRGFRKPLRMLDIGSGSGYITAAFAALCETASRENNVPAMFEVVGVEHVPELQKQAERVFLKRFPEWMEEHRVTLLHGDGRKPHLIPGAGIGPADAFDVIHVGATAPQAIVPEYIRLLRHGGTLVIPVGHTAAVQELQVFTKNAAGEVEKRRACNVRFVPLTSLAEQLDGDANKRH